MLSRVLAVAKARSGILAFYAQLKGPNLPLECGSGSLTKSRAISVRQYRVLTIAPVSRFVNAMGTITGKGNPSQAPNFKERLLPPPVIQTGVSASGGFDDQHVASIWETQTTKIPLRATKRI